MTDQIEQIKRAHKSARPTNENPAWRNTHSDLGIVLNALKEKDELFEVHTAAVAEFLNELGPYLGLEDGKVKPEDWIKAASDIRQWCANAMDKLGRLTDELEQAQFHGWTPTTENINSLPDPLREYIYGLETFCDPAGIVALNTLLSDQTRQLDAFIATKKKRIIELEKGLKTISSGRSEDNDFLASGDMMEIADKTLEDSESVTRVPVETKSPPATGDTPNEGAQHDVEPGAQILEDKKLADAVVSAGVGGDTDNRTGDGKHYYEMRKFEHGVWTFDYMLETSLFVRDWRVAGLCLKKWPTTTSTELFDSSDVLETADGKQHFLFRGTEYKIELKAVGVNDGSIQLRRTTINTENLNMTLDEMLRDPRAIIEAFAKVATSARL